MKNSILKTIKISAIFFFVGFLFFNFNAIKAEAACLQTGSGTWSATASFTGCAGAASGGAGTGNRPGSGEALTANAGLTLTIDVNTPSLASYTTSAWNTTTGTTIVTVNSGVTLTVTGAFTFATPTANATDTVLVNGTLDVGSLLLQSNTASRNQTLSISNTGKLTLRGALTVGGASGTKTLTTTGAAAIIDLNGGSIPATNLTTTLTAGTVLNSAGTSSITAASANWGAVTVSGGTFTVSGASTFASVNITGGTMTLGGVAVTVSGTTTVGSGTTLNASSATGTKKFTGNVTVNSTGTFDLKTGSNFATATSFGGSSISHSGTTFNTGTGSVTITGTGALSFAGSSNMNFGGTMTIPTNRALSNDKSAGTLTIGALTISSPTAANSFALSTGTTTTITGALTFSANTTANNQTITLKGTADLNVGGNLVMSGVPTSTGVGQIVCDATGTSAHVDVTGTTAINAATTAVAGKNIIDLSLCTAPVFSSVGLITITGNTTSLATSFPELKVGSGGTITASAGITTATNTNARLSTGSGSTINLTGALTIAGQASLTNINANTELKTTGTSSIASAITWAGSLNVVSGTTTLGAVAITISGTTTVSGALTYSSNAAAKTFTGLVTVTSGGSIDFNSLATDPAINLAAGVTANSGAGSINFGTGATALTATQAFTSSSNMTFGAVTVNSGVTFTNSVSTTLTLGSLTLASGATGVVLPTASTTSVTGAVAFTANATSTNTAITMSGTAALSVGGALTFNTPSSTGTQTLDVGSGTLTVTGLTTLNGGASATSTVTASTGTMNLNGGVTVGGTAANGRVITTGAGIVNFVGTWAGAGTFTFDSTTTFNTSGTVALNATITLPNLNVLSGTTSLGAVAIGVSGPTNITGALSYASGSQTKTFTGLVTINSGGSVDFDSLATDPATSFAAGITTNSGAGSINWGTGTATFSATQSLTGAVSMTFGGALTVSSGTLSNNSTGTITVGGTITLTGNLTQGSGSILNYTSGNAFSGAGTFDANTNANTVYYSRAGTQTVKGTTYRDLILSGTGAKTTTGVTVNGILTMAGDQTVTASANPTFGASATLKYDKTGTVFTTSAEWPSTITATGGVIINSNSVTLGAAKVLGLSTPLIINSGATLDTSGSNYQVTFGGDFDNNSGTFTANASPIVIANTATTQSIDGFTTTGTVSMTKTSGTATFAGNVNGGALTINGSGGTLNLGTSRTHTFTGDVTLTAGILNGGTGTTLNVNSSSTTAWNGTGSVFSAGTGTVVFGGANQTLAASATTFNNLTFSGSGGIKTLSSATTINGDFTNSSSGGGNSYATYDSAAKSTHITLSGGDLIVSNNDGGVYDYQVRATQGKSSGKWYWESTFVRQNPSYAYYVIGGVSPASESVETYTGSLVGGNGASITTDGETYVNGAFTPTGWGAWTDGQVAGFALDMDAGTLKVYRNNTLLGTITSGLSGGTFYPSTGTYQGIGTTTTNFGATPFVYTPPAGYNAGVFTPTYSTWSPSDKSANVTLSGGDLTATRAGQGSARGTIGKSSGKWYWEEKLISTTNSSYDIWLGVANSSESLSATPGDPGTNGWAIALDGGDYHHGGYINNVQGGVMNGATNDVFGFALDMDAGTLSIYRNGTQLIPAAPGVSGDPIFTGITGTIYPIVFYQTQTAVVTANFGATPFAYTPPSGYGVGVYSVSTSSDVSISTGNNTLTFGGDFINSSVALDAGSSNIIIAGTKSSQSIKGFTTTGTTSMTKTSGTATLGSAISTGALTIDGVGGTLNLGTSLAHTVAAATTLTNGAFNVGTSALTTGSFSSNNSNTRSIVMGAGTWTITGTGTVWDASGSLSVTPNTSTIKLTNTSATAKTFAGGGLTYNNIWFAGGAGGGSYTISGSNTFNNFKDDGSVAHSLLFTDGTTQHLSSWNVTGSAGQLITINGTSTGTHNLYLDGSGTVSADYLNIQHSIVNPQGRWLAGTHSINNQNVSSIGSGWIFQAEATYRGGGGGGGGEVQSGGGGATGGGGSGGGGSTTATGTLVLSSGVIQSVTMVSGGSGYTSAPIVSFCGAGSGAVGTAVLSSGSVASVTINNGGSGYNGTSTVLFGSSCPVGGGGSGGGGDSG